MNNKSIEKWINKKENRFLYFGDNYCCSDWGYGKGDTSIFESKNGIGMDKADFNETKVDTRYGDGYGSGEQSPYSDSDNRYDYIKGFFCYYDRSENISKIGNHKIYKINGFNTIVANIKDNIAEGFILRHNFTLERIYIVKENEIMIHKRHLRKNK